MKETRVETHANDDNRLIKNSNDSRCENKAMFLAFRIQINHVDL